MYLNKIKKTTKTHRFVQNFKIKFVFQFSQGENIFYTITFYLQQY